MITENILNRIISESINLVIEEKSGIHIKKKNKAITSQLTQISKNEQPITVAHFY